MRKELLIINMPVNEKDTVNNPFHMIKCKEILVRNMLVNEKNSINNKMGTTHSVMTSDTSSGGMMYDAASPDCDLSTLFADTSSSKLE